MRLFTTEWCRLGQAWAYIMKSYRRFWCLSIPIRCYLGKSNRMQTAPEIKICLKLQSYLMILLLTEQTGPIETLFKTAQSNLTKSKTSKIQNHSMLTTKANSVSVTEFSKMTTLRLIWTSKILPLELKTGCLASSCTLKKAFGTSDIWEGLMIKWCLSEWITKKNWS